MAPALVKATDHHSPDGALLIITDIELLLPTDMPSAENTHGSLDIIGWILRLNDLKGEFAVHVLSRHNPTETKVRLEDEFIDYCRDFGLPFTISYFVNDNILPSLTHKSNAPEDSLIMEVHCLVADEQVEVITQKLAFMDAEYNAYPVVVVRPDSSARHGYTDTSYFVFDESDPQDTVDDSAFYGLDDL